MQPVVVIVGGNDGIGKAIAQTFRGSYKVIIIGKDKEKTEVAARELDCQGLVADVTENSEITSVIEQIKADAGRIDVLVNCAGIWIEGKFEELDPAKIQETFMVNSLGTIYACQAVTPIMKEQKSGLMVNIISQAGLHSFPEREVYSGSKWAITGFTKGLLAELAPFNIRVSAVYPGKVNTGLFSKAGNEKSMDNAIQPEDVAKTVKFIADAGETVIITEIGMKHIASNG